MNYNNYLENREKILNKSDWSLIDHWPLYAGKYNLARTINNIELIKQTINVPGDIMEFGCWKGSNLMLMAKTLDIFSPMSMKKLWGFDLFEGLDFFDEKDGSAKNLKGMYKGSENDLVKIIKLFDYQGKINLIKGNILESLPKILKEKEHISLSLVYIDTDLYKTTELILNSLHERMMKGGLFVFDEFNHETWPGETVAAREFLKSHGKYYKVKSVSNSLQPSLIIEKL